MKKILIVDDEKDIADMFGLYLVTEGFSIETAEDGMEGLKKIEEYQPDIILFDLVMPEMDGAEFCQKVKSNFKDLDPLLIAMTAGKSTSVQDDVRKEGASAILMKPFEMKDLLNLIS